MPDEKGRPTWAEMSRGQRVAFVCILVVIFGGIAGFIWWLDSSGKSANDKAARTTISETGSATSETFVGGDVVWTATVTNTGSVAIPNLQANTDFGGLELKSIEPAPVKQEVAMIQDFGPLEPGASITITYHLLATKVQVANGFISFSGNFDTGDKTLQAQTVVR